MTARSTPDGLGEVATPSTASQQDHAFSTKQGRSHWSNFPGQQQVERVIVERVMAYGAALNETLATNLMRSGARGKLFPRRGEDLLSPTHLARRVANSVTVAASGCWQWNKRCHWTGYGLLTGAR